VFEAVILLVETAVVLGLAGWLVWEKSRSDRLGLRRRVVVNLVGGQAVEGVLWARKGRSLVLKDAKLYEVGAEPVGMDGEIVFDRDRVDFVQVHGS
jgi:hypothetical protein